MQKFSSAHKIVPFLGAGLLSSFGNATSDNRIINHSDESFDLAVRMPIGIEYLPGSVRVGIFGEIGLGFGFIPSAFTFATADVGARYYF